MKISLLGSLCALACVLSMNSAHAASDLACSLDQNANEASGNIAALVSRGYLAAGHKYTNGGGGVDDSSHVSTYSEMMDVGENLLLAHTITSENGGPDHETFELSAKAGTLKTDKQVFDALIKVSTTASKTLSADDASALNDCNTMLGQYIGVLPQP